MKLDVDLPPPFTYAPQFLVQAAVGVVLKSIVELILPQCARRHSMFIAPIPPLADHRWVTPRATQVHITARARLHAVAERHEGSGRGGGGADAERGGTNLASSHARLSADSSCPESGPTHRARHTY